MLEEPGLGFPQEGDDCDGHDGADCAEAEGGFWGGEEVRYSSYLVADAFEMGCRGKVLGVLAHLVSCSECDHCSTGGVALDSGIGSTVCGVENGFYPFLETFSSGEDESSSS